MNLYVFGHSICARSTPEVPSPTFVDTLFKKYSVPDRCFYGYAACSEERILYFLKKVKNPDAVIIFHGVPHYFFVPGLERDFDVVRDSDYIWRDPNWEYLNYFNSIPKDRPYTDEEWDVRLTTRYNDKAHLHRNVFKNMVEIYTRYFYTFDLATNRHNGALMQIDQYLAYKKIPVVHCVREQYIPSWFKFTSGLVDTELWNFQSTTSPYHCSYANSLNAVTAEGNQRIAERLEHLLGVMGIEPM